MRKETVLITGGAGFIGSHLADRLITEGYRVVVVDNLSSGKKSNLHPKVKFYQLDIRDPDLELVFKKERPTVVSHHAAQSGVRPSMDNPGLDAEVNVAGTVKVIKNSVEYRVRKIIFASSGGTVYGKQQKFPAAETHPLNPLCPYGVSKAAAETYLNYYHRLHGLEAVALRYANVYGPRQDPLGEAGVIAIFIQRLLAGLPPVVNGAGRQTRDFIYIKDVVEANLLAIKASASGVFNIGTGVETSVNEIVQKLSRLMPSVSAKHGPAKAGEQTRSSIDFKKAKKILGWIPRVSLASGLLKTVDYFKSFQTCHSPLLHRF